jgi:predicted MFS family arabinose efflux permease
MGERGRGHIYLQHGAWYLQFYQTENPDGCWLRSESRCSFTRRTLSTTRHRACDHRIAKLIVAYFMALTGAFGTIDWIPTFVKRLSGFSNQTVTSLFLIPALMGFTGMLINGCTRIRWPSGIGTVPFRSSQQD